MEVPVKQTQHLTNDPNFIATTPIDAKKSDSDNIHDCLVVILTDYLQQFCVNNSSHIAITPFSDCNEIVSSAGIVNVELASVEKKKQICPMPPLYPLRVLTVPPERVPQCFQYFSESWHIDF